jgi:hypothetical protein
MTSPHPEQPVEALTAAVRSGKDISGGHTLVVWVRLDLGAGPEWVAIGTVRGAG